MSLYVHRSVCLVLCPVHRFLCWFRESASVYFLFIYASSPQVDFCCICLSASEHSTCLLIVFVIDVGVMVVACLHLSMSFVFRISACVFLSDSFLFSVSETVILCFCRTQSSSSRDLLYSFSCLPSSSATATTIFFPVFFCFLCRCHSPSPSPSKTKQPHPPAHPHLAPLLPLPLHLLQHLHPYPHHHHPPSHLHLHDLS